MIEEEGIEKEDEEEEEEEEDEWFATKHVALIYGCKLDNTKTLNNKHLVSIV